MKLGNKLKIILIVLVMVCLVQGVIIYFLVRPDRNTTNNIDDFSNLIHNKFNQDQKSQWNSFDKYFNDDFFNREQDPFDELEKFHKRMEDMMEKSLNDSFSKSWDSWLEDRFSSGKDQMDMETEEKEDEYIITINIPNLNENKIVIGIDKNGVSIEGDFTQVLEKKDSDGRVISRQEKRQSISKRFPIPYDSDYEKADINQKDDQVIIRLPKKIEQKAN